MKTKRTLPPRKLGTTARLSLLALTAAASVVLAAAPPPATFRGFPANSKVTGASADGSVLCGEVDGSPDQAFRSTGGTLTYLQARPGPYGATASAISANGRVIVGYSGYTAPAYVLVRWVDGGAPQALGSLSGATGTAGIAGLTPDGAVLVGTVGDTAYPEGEIFRWTQAGGMVGLGMLSGGKSPAIRGLSADGALIVGDCVFPHPTVADRTIRKAWRWTSAGGFVALPALPEDNETQILATFSDGTALGRSRYIGSLGYYTGYREDTSAAPDTLVQWSVSGAVAPASIPPGVTGGNPRVTSPDGLAILGQGDGGRVLRWTGSEVEVLGTGATTIFGRSYLSTDGTLLYANGVLWDADHGERQLKEVLLGTYGVEAVRRWRRFDWVSPNTIRRSGDTLSIAGTAFNPDLGTVETPRENRAGWVATIPAPAGRVADPFGGAMLSRTATFTPGATFKEHYEEFILTKAYPAGVDEIGDPYPAGIAKFPAKRWGAAITVTASIAGFDLTTLNASTPVSLRLGDYLFSSTLGASDDWAPGKAKATFDRSNGVLKAKLTVVWAAGKVTFTVANSAVERLVTEPDEFSGGTYTYVDGFDASQLDWIGFPNYFGTQTVVPARPWQEVVLRLGVAFADRTGGRDLVLSGKGTTKGTDNLRTVDLAGAVDVTPPTASYLFPADKSVVFGPEISVRAQLNRVASVAIRLNGGAYETRSFRTANQDYFIGEWSWSSLRLAPGVNVIEIKVTDASGNESAPLKRTVTYSTLEGAYSSLVELDGAVAGYFTLSATRANTFTGRLVLGSKAYAFQGAFVAGRATVQVPRGKLPAFALNLQPTVPTDGRTTLAGSFTLDAATYSLDAGRSKLTPRVGESMLILAPDDATLANPALPRGVGALKVITTAHGGARVIGRLADGTPVSFNGVMDGQGRVPFYVPLVYGKAAGLLTGRAEWGIGLSDYPVFSGSATWVKPAQPGAARFPQAFTIESALHGGAVSSVPFYAPGGGDGIARFTSGSTELLRKDVTFRRAALVATTPRADKLTLTFAAGFARGSVILPGQTKPSTIFSASYEYAQGRVAGFGYCIDATASHQISILARP